MSVSEYVTNSLVKFETPELVENLNATRKHKSQPAQPNPNQETIDFLDTLLPPRTVIDGQQEYRLHASATQTSRLDVIKLEEQLDQLLKQRKARDKGICPIRSALYEDCMNELIREVALDLHERGMLLKEVKDELEQSIAAYNALYESAVAHGVRSAIHGEQNKNALKADNDRLEQEIQGLEDKIKDLNNRMAEAEKSDREETEAKVREHAESVATLKAENLELRKKLEEMLSPAVPEK